MSDDEIDELLATSKTIAVVMGRATPTTSSTRWSRTHE
jgi:hypothetical protein